MKRCFLWLAVILFLSQPVAVEAFSDFFIEKYINKRVEIGFVPRAILSSRLNVKFEQIILLKYNRTLNLCLVEVRYRAGMGREGLAIQIKKYWVDPAMIAFPDKD